MSESLHSAFEELKRADHLLYVSLKYSRTVDVIKSVIERLIACYDTSILALLEHFKEQKRIKDIPGSPIARAKMAKEMEANDKIITEGVDFYLLLRKISKADFTRAREFRRHVTMTVVVEGGTIEVNIDRIQEYFDQTKAFVTHIKNIMIT
jgi:hypothetical protein